MVTTFKKGFVIFLLVWYDGLSASILIVKVNFPPIAFPLLIKNFLFLKIPLFYDFYLDFVFIIYLIDTFWKFSNVIML